MNKAIRRFVSVVLLALFVVPLAHAADEAAEPIQVAYVLFWDGDVGQDYAERISVGLEEPLQELVQRRTEFGYNAQVVNLSTEPVSALANEQACSIRGQDFEIVRTCIGTYPGLLGQPVVVVVLNFDDTLRLWTFKLFVHDFDWVDRPRAVVQKEFRTLRVLAPDYMAFVNAVTQTLRDTADSAIQAGDPLGYAYDEALMIFPEGERGEIRILGGSDRRIPVSLLNPWVCGGVDECQWRDTAGEHKHALASSRIEVVRVDVFAPGPQLASLGNVDVSGDDESVTSVAVDDKVETPGIFDDWRLPTGVGVGVLGVGALVTSYFLWTDATEQMDRVDRDKSIPHPEALRTYEEAQEQERNAQIILGGGLLAVSVGSALFTMWFLDGDTAVGPVLDSEKALAGANVMIRW